MMKSCMAKRSLLGRMPGDDWQRFANLRTLLGYQWLFPGKKCCSSWAAKSARAPSGMPTASSIGGCSKPVPTIADSQRFVQDLNKLYRAEPAPLASGLRPRAGSTGSIARTTRTACSRLSARTPDGHEPARGHPEPDSGAALSLPRRPAPRPANGARCSTAMPPSTAAATSAISAESSQPSTKPTTSPGPPSSPSPP